jgi:SAM-dependent methyltransferase
MRDQQRDTWNRFAPGWKSWDATVGDWLTPVGEAMISHLDVHASSTVLDVATGTGEPGLSVAALIPRSRVTLTDLSEQMLAVAADRAGHRKLNNVHTRVCDAGALPFPDASFDAILCRFGFMFFPDVAAAATEFARVARPGARVVAAVWGKADKNPWATTIMGTIARHVALAAPAPEAPGLFRCASDGYLPDVLARAGFDDIIEQEVPFALVHDTPERYWDFMTDVAAPVVAGLALADEAPQMRIRAEVLDLARQHVQGGHVQMPSNATVVTGIRRGP